MTEKAQKIVSEIDLSEFAARVKCQVRNALDRVDDEHREKIILACKSPEISHIMISKRLTEWSGARVSANAIGRHRRGDCCCER